MMDSKIILYPTDVHKDIEKARSGVESAAEALEVECDCSRTGLWIVWVNRKDLRAFLDLAKEEANAIE